MIQVAVLTSRMPFRGILAVSLLMALLEGPAVADDLPLLVEIDSSSSQMRTTGPIPLTLRADWHGAQPVLIGDLTLNLIASDGDRVATAVLDNLHLSPGAQRFEFFLPAMNSDQWDTQFVIRPIFSTSTGNFPLRESTLFLMGTGRRTFVVTVVTEADASVRDESSRFGEALSLERFFKSNRSLGENAPILTLFRREHVRDLPTNPPVHCRQDLLIFTEGSFAAVSERQLSAVAAWVRAGGNVAVFVDDGPIDGRQFEGLHTLIGRSVESSGLSRTTTGQVVWPDDRPRLLGGACGLGRGVIAHESEFDRLLGEDLPSEWARIVCDLWGVRTDQREFAVSQGAFSQENMNRYPGGQQVMPPGSRGFLTTPFRPQPISGGSALLRETLPRGMQVVPLWVMGLMLFAYVLVIGPGEYLGLGALGARKYTWVTFPIVTFLFAGGAIVLSNVMMGSEDQGGQVTFVDVTSSGHVARENEIRLLFSAHSGSRELALVNSLYGPLDHRRLGASQAYQLRQTDPQSEQSTPPIVRGMLPNRGTAVESLGKWSPKFHRVLRIPSEPTPEPSGFDWTAPVDPRNREEISELRQRLNEAFGPGVQAQFWRRNGRVDHEFGDAGKVDEELDRIIVAGSAELMPAHDEHAPMEINRGNNHITTYETPDFLRTCSIRQPFGIFSVVSRIAPKCDDFLEDLAAVDSSDENAWLLAVAVRTGNRWTVYRRTYRVE